MFQEAGFVLAFHNDLCGSERLIDIATNHASPDEDVVGTVGMHEGSATGKRLLNGGKRRKLLPGDGEVGEIEALDNFFLTDHHRDGLTAEADLVLGKYGLIGEGRDHAKAVPAGNVLGAVNRLHAGVDGYIGAHIFEPEPGVVIGTTDGAKKQCTRRDFIGAEDFGAFGLALAVEADQSLADSGASTGGGQRIRHGVRSQHSGNDLAITGAAAEDTAQGVHDFGLRW